MADRDEPEGVQLPPDVRDVSALRVLLSVPPSIHESVVALLADKGRLYAINGGKRSLAGEQDYLTELSLFCERVPGAAGALADNRAILRANAREQARVDRGIRAMEHQKGRVR